MTDKAKPKKKNGRPKGGGNTKKTLIKAAIKADGSPTKMGKILNMHPQSARDHLQKPDIKAAVISARERALEEAGAKRVDAVKTILEGMKEATISANYEGEVFDSDVPDRKERRDSAKLILQLFGDLDNKDQGGGPSVVVNMPIIMMKDGKPLKYNFSDE